MHIERRDRTKRKKAKHVQPEDSIPRIHEIVFNRPPVLPAVYANLDDLVILKQELYYDYRKVPDYRKVYRDAIRWIQEYPYEKLKRGEQVYDGPMMLELGVRSVALVLPGILCPHHETISEALSIARSTPNMT